ncbi:transcriptional regulator, TetR family [Parvibaculum lavamentivorans DS-1]|uniref:Transcriptional regulator, TetR family n=1 Tax=Parvibaculum lavamentivorans (strain DS-1 / DSM 13023 / NCIMB 13966) TaxID=402881 RepID=A7HWI0_PARL1|nr:TetR/AcrR family transcriptional regulator [Parvibaculum lavamentivorans]ABS64263.1 transcriptional regulator, TetR family [Parvibaculum lavamentivorans DS-1]
MSNETSPAADNRRTAQREALLDAASEMLMLGGPDAISLRKLATKVGTSTMAVYTAFGGKEGLITALFEEAFDRLAATELAVPRNPEPLLWLADLARAYRSFALKNPSYYALMISATLPVPASLRHSNQAEGEPPARSITRHPSYQTLLDAVEACVADGSLPSDIEAEILADALWAAVHGLSSLELAGFHISAEAAEKRFNVTAGAVLRGLLTPAGLKKLDGFTRGS